VPRTTRSERWSFAQVNEVQSPTESRGKDIGLVIVPKVNQKDIAIGAKGLDGHRHRSHIRPFPCHLGSSHGRQKIGKSDRDQDQDDRDNNEEFDEGEASGLPRDKKIFPGHSFRTSNI